jgi:hypothetical protein
MPKFLASCHYNEEEFSQHLKKRKGYWLVLINGNKFATDQILKKTGRSCEGVDFRWLNSKSPKPYVEQARAMPPRPYDLLSPSSLLLHNCSFVCFG